MKKHIFSLMVLFSSFNCAIAQEDKIETDRPDETESPNIVAKKWLQFEGGFTSQKNDESNREYLLPTLLTKYGLSKRIELRLITEVKTESSLIIPNGTVYKTTLQQVQLGAKVALF